MKEHPNIKCEIHNIAVTQVPTNKSKWRCTVCEPELFAVDPHNNWEFITNEDDKNWFQNVYQEDFTEVSCSLCKTALGHLYEYMEGSIICNDCYKKFPLRQ